MAAQSEAATQLCSPLVGSAEGHVIFNSTSRQQGGIVAISCSEGLRLKGLDVLECLESGLWSGPVPGCFDDTSPAHESPSLLNNVIIGVVVVACIVATVVLVGATYAILISCRRRRKQQQSACAQNNKLMHISMFLNSMALSTDPPPSSAHVGEDIEDRAGEEEEENDTQSHRSSELCQQDHGECNKSS